MECNHLIAKYTLNIKITTKDKSSRGKPSIINNTLSKPFRLMVMDS